MAKTDEHKEIEESTEPDMRGKLLARLAVAGVLVAVLLGILAFFDHLSSVPEEEDAVVFSKPVPVAPKKPVSQPVTPAELPEPPAPAPVEATPPPVAEAVPPAPPASPAKTEAKAEIKPETKVENTATAAPTTPHVRSRPLESAPVAAAKPVRSVPEWTAPPVAVADSEAAPKAAMQSRPTPTARVIESHGAPPAPSGVARLFSGFLLQAGVFSSAQRAEELHAKLTLSGVQSTLETRVQVGPFRTRQEAELAQAKLRELGVDTVLVPPRTGR